MTAERKALEILQEITRGGAYANLALKDGLADEPANAARVTALVYTALENLNYCDHIIDHYAKGRLHSVIRGVLRLALTEIFFMDTPDHAACSRYTGLTASIGKAKLKGFVNGVLRNVIRDRDADALPPLPESFPERMEILHGVPAFMAEEYARRYGESFTEELLSARVKGAAVRAVYPHTPEELFARLDGLGVPYVKSELIEGAALPESLAAITGDEFFASGGMTVQSEGAMLAARCLGVKPGLRVLDACAAPGGKTAYICDVMQRRGSVTAWDIHPHRVVLIKNTLRRLGIEGVDCSVRDASVPAPEYENAFDAILLDVPCSGLGGGSKPDARYRRTRESIEEISSVQRRILEACSGYLAPGGALVYSTCTLSERENEGVVRDFLETHTDFYADPLAGFLPEALRGRGDTGMLTLFPNVDGTEGFFIARLVRKA